MPRAWLALLVLGVAGFASSQSEATAVLEQARAVAAEAREAYDIDTPDQRLWRETLNLAQRAHRLAPDDLETKRFLAKTYSEVNWYVRAFDAWLAYLDAGGNLEPRDGEGGPDPRQAFTEAGNQLGFSRYESGNLAASLGYYQQVLRHVSDDPETLYWLGRLNLELGEETAARGYFERLLEEDPEHQTASFYLSLIDERERVGEAASAAYRRGLSAYEEGRLTDAHEAFVEAAAVNQQFTDAAVWAGRTALELEQPRAAVPYWERVVEQRPGDAGARYFLEVARAQARWGVEAGRAFYQGQAAYEVGDLGRAAAEFERAVAANPDMIEAWVWAARANQENGFAEDAVHYWSGVLERRPDDERARYFLEVANQQIRHGEEAGRAFVEAVRNYQLAELALAEQGFLKALEANPDFAAAWGWLGRVYFTRADYGRAAEAYSRALELEPHNSDYAFFAEESLDLAGEATEITLGNGSVGGASGTGAPERGPSDANDEN